MGLFTPDLFRSLALGFLIGIVAMGLTAGGLTTGASALASSSSTEQASQ